MIKVLITKPLRSRSMKTSETDESFQMETKLKLNLQHFQFLKLITVSTNKFHVNPTALINKLNI